MSWDGNDRRSGSDSSIDKIIDGVNKLNISTARIEEHIKAQNNRMSSAEDNIGKLYERTDVLAGSIGKIVAYGSAIITLLTISAAVAQVFYK